MMLNSNRDYLLVRDGDNPKSKPIARLTGNAEDNQRIIVSTSHQLYIYFKTSLGDSQKGFNIKYTQGNKISFIKLFLNV